MTVRASAAPAVHRFTREEYHRMGEAGLFADERVELLDGEIMTMSPQNPPHAGITSRIAYALLRLLGPTVSLRVQLPLVLNDWSEPEPDIAVCQPDPDDYEREHPRADQVLLVIEVADTSLAYDRSRKITAYAGSGIPAYWIVNLIDRRVEVLTEPVPVAGRYRQEQHVGAGDMLVLPGGALLAASDILPRY